MSFLTYLAICTLIESTSSIHIAQYSFNGFSSGTENLHHQASVSEDVFCAFKMHYKLNREVCNELNDLQSSVHKNVGNDANLKKQNVACFVF